jgi:hypothetical protein
VTIDDLQSAVGQFTDHQRVDITDLSQDAAESVGLLLWVLAPVLRMRTEVTSANAA